MVVYWGMGTAVVRRLLLHLSLRQAQESTRKSRYHQRPAAVLGVAGCAATAVLPALDFWASISLLDPSLLIPKPFN